MASRFRLARWKSRVRRGKARRLFWWILVLMLGALLLASPATGAVTLVYFRATAQPGRVILEWQTASELDNQGFFINRSLSQFVGYSRISEFIPAKGDSIIGATYSYTDTAVINGTTYWYKLESIDFLSNVAFYDPPVSAIPGGAPTVTPTATGTISNSNTPTSTRTPTRTATVSTTRTPTRTQSVTAATRTPTVAAVNPYPAPFQSGNNPPASTPPPTALTESTVGDDTGVITATLPISATHTPTLIPLPEITMQFPTGAGVGSALPTPPSAKPASFTTWLSWLTPARVLLIIFILFVWLFLGGWFYSSVRRIES